MHADEAPRDAAAGADQRAAEGAWLYDYDGQRYLDAISSWWVNLFGHANPRINAALHDQLDKLEHVMLAGFTHAPVIELSERLSALTGSVLGHAFYASRRRIGDRDRAEDELSLLAQPRAGANKHGSSASQGSYHGETLGALGVTDVALFSDAYAPLLRAARVVAVARCARRAATARPPPTSRARRARRCEALSRRARTTQIAALIVEPLVQCAAGMAMHDAALPARACARCATATTCT